MSLEREQAVMELLEAQRLGWALKGDPGAAGRILERIEASSYEYERVFGTKVDLLATCQAQPEELRAYLQTLTAGVSAAFLAMVARVLLRGAEVVGLHLDFITRKSLSLRVEIADPDGHRHTFDSAELWDAQVLRHFGLMKADGTPVIDGYYAARD